ncbi:hypothetical protein G9A89_023432 [Geosiphon pyriformis]|nr:hypothetical protein G9A89_023432 [Geosiphon pyriformis]
MKHYFLFTLIFAVLSFTSRPVVVYSSPIPAPQTFDPSSNAYDFTGINMNNLAFLSSKPISDPLDMDELLGSDRRTLKPEPSSNPQKFDNELLLQSVENMVPFSLHDNISLDQIKKWFSDKLESKPSYP